MAPYNAQSWKQLIQSYTTDVRFASAVSKDELASVEQKLKLQIPEQLTGLLTELNGLSANYGSTVIWSAADVTRRNTEFRTNGDFRELYMPFDHLLFFADDGGGDQFAFAIHADGQVHKDDIFLWEHETDARSWYAGRLEQFFELRLKVSNA